MGIAGRRNTGSAVRVAACKLVFCRELCQSGRSTAIGTAFALRADPVDEAKRLDVSIEGRVTIDTSGLMRRTVADALRSKPPALRLDLSGVSYLDTSGLATLVEASRIARQQGTQLQVQGLQGQPRELLHFSQIDHLLDIAEREWDRTDARP